MPRFYFHLWTPIGVNKDHVGCEFASMEVAYLDAFDAIGTMTVDLMRQKANPRQYGFEITDITGKTLFDLPFAEYLDQGRRSVVPPTSVGMQRTADELRRRQEAAAHALLRYRTLQIALEEQRAALQENLADTKRLLGEAQRFLVAFQPFRCV
ncbi:DUF6894 family protein [Methylobacterium currus]|uniref:DUF6894 family protein n=1 Tax=Methylobacterium currus TaxID=2051553 RepID=UPI000F4F328C|nr:hypothetical protein [Methylobacterium currus]